MAKSLVIVESPAKAKTIGKYLGNQYVVKASLGHIKDLPKKDLAVDVDGDFRPNYQIIEGKKKLITELKQAAKKVEFIYLAADPDREGEAICQHLHEELDGAAKDTQVYRVMFNEITQKAIRQAFEKPMTVNLHLVEAQQARRVLDRLVGYKISPLLWDKVRRGLSAGRVQTVALRLIVERERSIRAFEKREYWTIDVQLNAKKTPVLKAGLAKRNGENVEIASETASTSIVSALDGTTYTVSSVGTREKRRNPVAPFITSTLQQESARKLRFSVKRTMMIAQKLYEGVELGKEGAVGLITYMRTDSTRIAPSAADQARDYIRMMYGKEYLPDAPRLYSDSKSKNAQDAHEAIRPTDPTRRPELIRRYLKEDQYKLYELIWQRFMASQMTPAVFDTTTIDFEFDRFLFRATGSVMKFDGYQRLYKESREAEEGKPLEEE